LKVSEVKTLGQLKKSGYSPKTIKQELRTNLIDKLKSGEKVFDSIIGFDDTVIPDLERAILSNHNILLLGLRGQAKTKIARLLTTLLDEHIPIIEGSEINDDPMEPISRYGRDLIAELGDKTPISWVHQEDRYVEKLATPDVSVADLIGDVDPIKAASLKLPFSDERVIHFGLIPRSHRSIFVINELPDLQARIQVSLFNMLQEEDLQIRGFKLRLPLDIQFVFTANPEDYTNRGTIVTPLKDRIESQILTHYPMSTDIARSITTQEAKLSEDQKTAIHIPEKVRDLLEMISFTARDSEFVDEKSGISARMSISGMENLFSTAERRMLINKEKKTTIRITDFWGVIPSITGKMELVYEGEQEGPYQVALKLLGTSIKSLFLEYFPHPDKIKKGEERDPYGTIRAWFSGGNNVDLLHDDTDKEYKKKLDKVAGLRKLIEQKNIPKEDQLFFMELVLHSLSEFQVLSKNFVQAKISFNDPLATMFDDLDED